MELSRRDLLDMAVRAAALPGAAQFLSAWLQAGPDARRAPSQAPPDPAFLRDYKPRFFTADDFDALRSFTELLIPTDETPGAREARCAHYIDFVLQAAEPAMQKQWSDAMAALKNAGFHAASTGDRLVMITEMARPESDRTASHPLYPFYRLIKQQNTFAFYTSRAGMIETLDYRGNTFNAVFPGCDHPEHQRVD